MPLNAEIGQSKSHGETLGQIDDLDQYKLSVFIDEFNVNPAIVLRTE